MQVEAVGVQMSRKLAAEGFQRGTLQCDGCDELVLGRRRERLTEKIDRRAVALYWMSFASRPTRLTPTQ